MGTEPNDAFRELVETMKRSAAALRDAQVPFLLGVITAEHFFGSALTTVMFSFMMSRTDRTIGGTHYTLLAAIEVLGKAVLSLPSGVITEQLGYARAFSVGVALSLAWSLFVALRLRPAAARA